MNGRIISHHHGFIKSPYPGFTPSSPVCFFQTSATVASTLYPPQTPFLLPTPVPTPIYCGPTFLCPTPVTMVPSIILGHTHSYPPVEINRKWILNSNVLVHASSLIHARNWEISKGNLRDQGINKREFGKLPEKGVKNKTATFTPAPGEGGVKIKTDQASLVKAIKVATQTDYPSPCAFATTPPYDDSKANCGLHSLQKVTDMSENRLEEKTPTTIPNYLPTPLPKKGVKFEEGVKEEDGKKGGQGQWVSATTQRTNGTNNDQRGGR